MCRSTNARPAERPARMSLLGWRSEWGSKRVSEACPNLMRRHPNPGSLPDCVIQIGIPGEATKNLLSDKRKKLLVIPLYFNKIKLWPIC